jgi:hypothetical protein
MRASVGLVVLWIVSGVALADEGPACTAPQGVVPTHVEISVIQDQSDAPILVVKYPWSAHPQASVEVCLLPKDVPDSPAVRPLDLTGRLARDKDAKLVKAVHKCQDGAASVPTAVSVTDGNQEFDILGNRNSVGSAAVAVGWKTQTPGLKPIHHAAFCRLESWAVDRDTLMLDLPPEHFCRPGTLKVWLLRGDEVVWSEMVPWQESTLGPWSALAAANPESSGPVARKEKPANQTSTPSEHRTGGSGAPKRAAGSTPKHHYKGGSKSQDADAGATPGGDNGPPPGGNNGPVPRGKRGQAAAFGG